MSVRCEGWGVDYRSMWVYGLSSDERYAITRCSRPKNHRGKCLHHPNMPPYPLRPIRFRDEHRMVGGIPLLTPMRLDPFRQDLGTL